MPGDKTRDLRKVNRRSFLRKLSAMGVSGAALQYMTKDALADVTDDPSDEIPILLALRHKNPEEMAQGNPPKREPIYGTMPRDEWALTEAAHNAAERIDKQVRQIGAKASAGVEASTDRSDVKVVVDHDTSQSDVEHRMLDERLPDSVTSKAGKGEKAIVVENIPVRTREASKLVPLSHGEPTHFDEEYRPVPGGAHIVTTDTNAFFDGTTCIPAYSSETGYGMVTAGHLFLSSGEITDDTDREVWQSTADTDGDNNPEDDNIIGHCYYAQFEDVNRLDRFDGAFISLHDANGNDIDHIYQHALPSGSTTNYDYMGVVAWDNLANRYIDELKVQGASTKYSSGTTYTTYNTSNGRAVDLDVSDPYEQDAYRGDSGGPVFTEQDYNGNGTPGSYIAAPVSGGYDEYSENEEPFDRVMGTYIQDIESQFDLIV